MARGNKNPRIRENFRENQTKARSFLADDDAQQFKWAIRSDKIDCKHEFFGFHPEIQKIFIDKILPTLRNCSTMTWKKISKNRHCHSWKDVTELSKELQVRITELFGENGPETLFQISYRK